MHQPNLYYITYRSRSVVRPSTKSPTARMLFMDPQVLPTPLGFVISKLKIPRKRVLPFTNAVVKVCFEGKTREVACSLCPSSCSLLLLILKLQLSVSQWWYFCHLGLFNICDKLLVAIDILLEWRELFKRGCPISSFIKAKSEQLVLKLNKVIFKFP